MDKTVLAYIQKGDCYLMLFRNKKENDINQGKYVGVGGHIEIGETPEQALIREIKEETGLTAKKYALRATLYFYNDDYSEEMYLYTVNEYVGEIIECDEGRLEFLKISELSNYNMWEGDKYFLDLIKDDSPYFEMALYYCKDQLVEVKRLK